ncbi:DUF3800 domain-containing protein [Oceanithermus profundus]
MDIFFADDSRQGKPSRPGMGPLVAAGGVYVPEPSIKTLEREIDQLCLDTGFPNDNESGKFKWSPGRDLWMRDNLVGEDRKKFFIELLTLAHRHDVNAIVVVADIKYNPAIPTSVSPEDDVITLLLERVNNEFEINNTNGLVVVDRPSGGRGEENKFLMRHFETLRLGTRYVDFNKILLNVLSASSNFIRILQLADVVTSATTAYVSGEDRFSPDVFEYIKPLLSSRHGRRGGFGLKIHPDAIYVNLYYWLLNDSTFYKKGFEQTLPISGKNYFSSPMQSLKSND